MPSLAADGGTSGAASGAGTASQAGSALRTAKANTSSPINDEQRSLGPDLRALNREAPARYSEFPPLMPKSKSPSTKKTSAIHFDRRDVSIGRARYQGATHYSKNIAVKPNYIAGGGDLMSHCNVEVELYDKSGRPIPMQERWFRDWAYYPVDPAVTIRTFKGWDGRNLPGAKEGLRTVPGSTKRFLFDGASATDAPGQQNIIQDKQTYFYLQEFVAGNEQAGDSITRSNTCWTQMEPLVFGRGTKLNSRRKISSSRRRS